MSVKFRLMAAALVGSMVATAAYAQNNNTGQIVVQGVVPGAWELTVYDITSGYDFDLSTAGSATSDARVGTIHVATNNAATAGLNTNASSGTMIIESANAGRMVNDQSLPGIAADAMDYRLALAENEMNPMHLGGFVRYDDQSWLANSFLLSEATYTTDGSVIMNMNTPKPLTFALNGEATYDILITLNEPVEIIMGAPDNRPQASGVYSDTLTFTIFDDDE